MKYKLFLLFFAVSSTLAAQNLTKEAVSALIEKKEFKFTANRMIPSRGPSKYLSSGEADVIVGKVIKSHLPFYGVAYSSMIGEESGFKFTSEDFEYSVTEKKRKWIVDIKFNDLRHATNFNFTITENGNATLYVNSSNRQGIQFNGHIEAIKSDITDNKTIKQSANKMNTSLVLDNYRIPLNKEGALVGKLSETNAKLIKDNANIFVLNNGVLSLKDDQSLTKDSPMSYNIEIESNGLKKAFILVKDEFIKNKVIAHRGAWKNNDVSQNSLGSLNASIKIGCEAAELDVRLTSDNVVVLSHDPTIGGLDVAKSTLSQMSKVPLKQNEFVPTLKQYLERVMQQNKTHLVVELKVLEQGGNEQLAIETVALIHEMGAQAWVEYISFGFDISKHLRELDPTAKISYLEPDKTLEEIKNAGLTGIDFHKSIFAKEEDLCKRSRDLGLSTNAWTVNNEKTMVNLLEQGLDYITTDEPELLLSIVNK